MSETKEITYRYRWVVMGILWAAYIVVFMQRLSIGPLAPFIKDELGLTSAQVGSLISSAAFGYVLSIIPAGWAADRLGVRRLLAIGPVVGGIFMLGMFLAPSYRAALVIMAMSGFGCGSLLPSTTKGVTLWFPMGERATMMGFKQTGVNVGGIVTAAVLPGIALALGWRFGFLFLGILAIVIGITSFILYKDPPVSDASPTGDSVDPTSVATAARGKPLRELFKSRDIWLVAFAGFAIMVVEFAVIAHLVLYLTEVLFFPVVTAGVILAVTQAGGILGKPGGGFLSDRFSGSSRRNVFMLWSGITCVICILIALWGTTLSWALYPILFILGVTAIGWGGVYLALVAELAGVELVGRVTGIAGVFTMLGCIAGPIVFGYIVDTSGSYQPAWLSCAAYAVICVLLLFFVREERRMKN